MSDAFLGALRAVPDTLVIDDPSEMQPHLVDWRKRHEGRALAVVLPASTEAVAAVVALCARHRVPVYPQGGNTSVCGGSVPDAGRRHRRQPTSNEPDPECRSTGQFDDRRGRL